MILVGIYFNPGNESFRGDSGSRIYIDKTGLIKELNQLIGTSERYIAVSHARRFGKSQAAGMIDAYYSLGSDSKELFSKFEISKNEDFEEHLNKYNVIHLDISSVADHYKEGLVGECFRRIYNELVEEFGNLIAGEQTIEIILSKVYKKTGIPFVIIIDEWDCVVRNHADRLDLVHEYLQFLHSLFKSEESKSYLALAYITGILPIKKIKDESALNNFVEYTMIKASPITKYFGFTEKEVEKLCKKYQMDFASVKEWYNGYLIDGIHMYNPNSVYRAMVQQECDSYWKNTSAFDTINKFITLNFDGLKEDILKILSGEKVTVNIDTFKNDLSEIGSKDEALTALIHLGYLGYNAKRKQAYLPNYEVGLAYQAALATGNWKEIADTIGRCDELLWATIDGEEEKVAELVELAHEAYTSILQYNNENALSCVLTMAYFTAPAYYNVVRELPSGKGFADFAFIPRSDAVDHPAMIIELKWDQDADSAICQMKEKRYAGKLKGYGEEIILVGISYDKDLTGKGNHKKHYCVIERYKN